MKGNVFQQWLKEFCALVFAQTVQAFILAIILVLVATCIEASVKGNDTVTGTEAAGFLAIIALTSISKMESLIKKMFGLGSSLTDTSMNGGKGGLLGTYMAMQMGKRVFDNVPKLFGGINDRVSAGRDAKKAKLNRAKAKYNALNRYNDMYPGSSTADPSTGGSGTGGGTGSSGEGYTSSSESTSTNWSDWRRLWQW